MGMTVLPFTGNEVFNTPNNLPSVAAVGSSAVVLSPFNFYIYDGSAWRIGNSENFLPSVAVATTANITLSGEQTIDGVLTSTSSVLVKNQTLGQNNGVYTSGASTWTRRADASTSATITAVSVWVTGGTVNGNTAWYQSTNSVVLGTTPLVWVQTDAEATNFVDLTSNQSAIAGNKTFTGNTALKGTAIIGNNNANYYILSGAASNNNPIISTTGSDTDVSSTFTTKGAGVYNFLTGTTVQQFKISHTASAVNYISITGSITTSPLVISASGSDTNIGITLTPKGSGIIIASSAVNLSTLTASKPLHTDASKNIISAPISLTADISGILSVVNGGTNSGTALNNNSIIISSSGALVEATAITASKALVSDTNGIPIAATTSTTELNFVSGVTSSIQTQLNTKAPSASPTFTGTVSAASTSFSGISIRSYQYSAPTTGDSITMTKSYLLIHSTITILSLTITLPSTPTAGQIACFASDAAISTLTIVGATDATITSLTAGSNKQFMYESTNATWFLIG